MLSSVEKSGEKLICSAYYDYNGNNQITSAENNCNNNKITHTVNTYDKNGNLVKTECEDTETVKDYTYDNENRLKAIKENGTLLMAALYDGNGDRIFRLDYRKTASYISNKAGTAENVYYPTSSVNKAYDADVIMDEMLIPNGVTNNTAINYELTGYINNINSEYTQVLTEFGANGGTTNIYEYGENREIATINGTKSYYMYDGRGSVASLTGSSSSNLVSYTYDAYGEESKSGNTLNNPYRYNAEYTDSSTGYQYLRARYYNPATGRFLTKDTVLGSIEKPITRNLYAYCGNNPLNITDPSGHGWWSDRWNDVKNVANKVGSWFNNNIIKPVKSVAKTVGTWIGNTVKRNATYYSDPNSLHINPNISEINNGGPYYTNLQDQYYQSQSNRFFNRMTYLKTKAEIAIEEIKKRLCETSDRIVEQQLAKDTLQLQIYNEISNNSDVKTIKFAIKHPIIASKVGEVKQGKGVTNISTNSTRFSNAFGLEENEVREGSQVNAVRHALWIATITNRYGDNIANQIGDSHESGSNIINRINDPYNYKFNSLSDADTAVDYLNNIVGHDIGNSSSKNITMKEMTGNVLDYYYNEGLNVAQKNNDGTYSIIKEKLSKNVYNDAKNTLNTLDDNGFPPDNSYYNKK